MSGVVITVDGPSGVGKGTLSARLATHYGYHFLDSGALYRLVGYAAAQKNWLPESEALSAYARQLPVVFKSGEIFLAGEQVTQAIRTESIAAWASKVAAVPAVRAALLAFQQSFAQEPGLIADGRDMGTVIFPQAMAKLFLDASVEVRADRRVKQLKNQGLDVNIDQIAREIRERDDRDRNRPIAPLKPAEDALVIDTSTLTPDAVFSQAIEWIEQRIARRA